MTTARATTLLASCRPARAEAVGLALLCIFVFWQTFHYRPGVAHVYADQSTYAMAALSLAFDGDLRYEQHDLERFATATPWQEPHGLFLKKTADGRYFFAKPPLYGLVCAPLARWLGVPGMIVTNAVIFCLLLVLATLELRRSLPGLLAASLAAALLFLSPFYIFVFVVHPDLFYALLLMSSLVCARRYSITQRFGYLLFAAALAAVATSEKTQYAILYLALVPAARRKAPARRLPAAIAAGLLTFGLLLAVQLVQDGQPSSYLGERGYYTRDRGGFPFEPGYDGSLQETSANYNPVLAAAFAAGDVMARLGNLPEMAREALFGRQTGLVPYFPLLGVLLVLSLMSSPRLQHGCCWLGLLSILAFYAIFFPENTYGGTASFGSRYALQALPVVLFSLRRDGPLARRLERHRLEIGLLFAACLMLGAVVLGPAVRSPYGMVARAQAFVASPPLTRFAIEYPQLEVIFKGARHYPWRQGPVSLFPVDGLPEVRTERGFSLPPDGTQTVVLESRQAISSITMHFSAVSDVVVTTVAERRASQISVPAYTTRPHTVRFAGHEKKLFKKGAVRHYQKVKIGVRGGGHARWRPAASGRSGELGILITAGPPPALESLLIVPRPYVLGTELRFVAERPAVGYLNAGWSYPEAWGTWSEGDASFLTLPMSCPAGGELVARFRVGAYVNEHRPEAGVRVRSRGRELARWRFTESGTHRREIVMPAAECRQGRLALGFEHESPRSPQELGRGTDPRRLNLSLVTLMLSRRPPPAPE